jgi:hypothetical protein
MEKIIVYKIRPDGVFDGDLEIEVSDPFKSPIPAGTTKTSPYPIPQDQYAYMNGGWKYANGDAPIFPPPSQIAQENKAKAEKLLTETDWTQIADVQLLNKQEFADYRAVVRAIALNPTAEAIFPELPVEQWS